MNTARKGRKFEHEIINLLKGAGFSVIRGAGSKGMWRKQKVDLVFSKETDQTKYTVVMMGGMQCKAEKISVSVLE
jgi:Holliday junction resolvase